MDGIIQLLIIVVFVLISAAWQFMTERPQKKAQPRRPPERPEPQRPAVQRLEPQRPEPQRPQAGGEQPAQQPRGGGLEAEIEDFLRQVTGQGPKREPPPEPVTAEPILAEPVVTEVELVRAPRNQGIGNESVEDHVDSHLRKGRFGKRETHLASQIENRDEAMDAHLHDVFDHQVGALERKSQSGVASELTWAEKSQQEVTAGEILALFKSPIDMRKAIIMKEILTPKSEEW